MRGSAGYRQQYNGTYPISESHFVYQRLSASYITADAVQSMTGVKPVQSLHSIHDPHFHVIQKRHAASYDLKIHVRSCNMCQKERLASST